LSTFFNGIASNVREPPGGIDAARAKSRLFARRSGQPYKCSTVTADG
jgi:hypothetical protein